MKLLLFDIDGTLLLTAGAGMRAMHRAGQRLFGPRFSFEHIVTAGGLDPLLLAEAIRSCGLTLADGDPDRFRDAYLPELELELRACAADVQLMPGVVELIERLRDDERVRLGLLSGNYAGAAPIKLRAAGIDPGWFEVQSFADHGPDRPSLVRHAMTQHGDGLDPTDVIVIGDTPRDVDCAKVNGCIAFGVATGRYSVSDLEQAGADAAVASLADAGPLFELIEGEGG